MVAWRPLALLILPTVAVAIECYTGWTYFKGQPFATGKETCKDKKYCYNLTLDSASALDGVRKVGCSSWRCKFVRDGCHSMTIGGQKVTFCCCQNSDKCNSKYSQMKLVDRVKEGAKDVMTTLEDIWKKIENPFGR